MKARVGQGPGEQGHVHHLARRPQGGHLARDARGHGVSCVPFQGRDIQWTMLSSPLSSELVCFTLHGICMASGLVKTGLS